MKRNYVIKIIVALTGIALVVSIVFFTPLWSTVILLSVLSALCNYELCAATEEIQDSRIRLCSLFTAALMPWIWYLNWQAAAVPFVTLLIVTAVFLFYARRGDPAKTKTISYCVFSAVVLPSFFALLIPILSAPDGKQIVVIPFVSA